MNPPNLRDTIIKGIKPTFGTDPFYVAYVGVAYNVVKQKGRKQPYAARHTLGINYSPVLNSLHPYYENNFPQAFAKLNVSFKVGYDGLRRMNFYGVGNETQKTTSDNRFNWMRTRQQYATADVGRTFAKYHNLTLSVLYDGIQVLNDENRFVGKSRRTIDPQDFNWQYFVGNRLRYTYTRLDDPVFPIKGLDFSTSAGYTESLKRSSRSFARYTTDLEAYFPLSSSFSLAVHGGVSTVSGNPDFYQYNSIGGGATVRGYRRWRFYGKTAFYNQNEIRWITAVEKGGISGHFGFVGFYDQGRIWQPGEASGTMHFGYGGGVILAPFDKIWVTGVLAISNEGQRTHFAVRTNL